MQPKLSLVYASGGGNGLLGPGWSISGLSSIARCPRTWAQDGPNLNTTGRVPVGVQFDSAKDELCLDGQRLIAAPSTSVPPPPESTEFRTEIESFNRIIAMGIDSKNPEWIQVESKSGLISKYGFVDDSANSRLESSTAGSAPRRQWALSSVQDRLGNKMTIQYIKNVAIGDFRPSHIQYSWTNNGNSIGARVAFNYDPTARPDVMRSYVWGSMLENRYRLSSVDTELIKTGGTFERVTRHNLHYTAVPSYVSGGLQAGDLRTAVQTSLLKAVVVCPGAASTRCLPPVQFSYTDEMNLSPDFQTFHSALGHLNYKSKIIPGDFLGQGIDSLLVSTSDDCNATSAGSWCWNGWQLFALNSSADGYVAAVANGAFPPNFEVARTIIPGDFDGSGRASFMVFHRGYYQVDLSNGSGFTMGPAGYLNSYAESGPHGNENIYAGDFFGDGKISLLTNSKRIMTVATLLYCNYYENSGQQDCTYDPPYGYEGWRLFRYCTTANHPECNGTNPGPGFWKVAEGTTGLTNGQRATVARFTGETASQILVTMEPDIGLAIPGGYTIPSPECTPTGAWSLYNFTGSNLSLIASGNFLPNIGVSDIIPGNFGGDGLASLLIVPHAYSHHPCTGAVTPHQTLGMWNGWYLYRATGNGFTMAGGGANAPGVNAPYSFVFGTVPAHKVEYTVGDFNGDGRDGVFAKGSYLLGEGTTLGNYALWASTGTGFVNITPANNPPLDMHWWKGVSGSLFRGTATGLIFTHIGTYGGATPWAGYKLMRPTWTGPRLLLSSINNGQTTVNVTYKALNTPGATPSVHAPAEAPKALHTPSTGAVHPVRDVQTSMPVVSQLTVSNGIGGVLTNTYKYEGLRADVSGRGLLGFRKVVAVQIEAGAAGLTGATSIKTFSQAFPFTGAVTQVLGYMSSFLTANTVHTNAMQNLTTGAAACKETGTPACPALKPSSTAFPHRYFVYKTDSEGQGFDVEGVSPGPFTARPGIPVRTESTFDTHGNELTTKTSSPDGFSTLIQRVFSNDVANWLLGRVTSQTTTATAPDP